MTSNPNPLTIDEIKTILIVGTGTMGQQIGLQCAMHGYDVILYDIAPQALETANARIKYYAALLVHQTRLTQEQADAALARMRFTTDLQDASAADLVSESVPEEPALKAQVLSQLAPVCPPRAIFTTNTSTLVPSMYADATGRPAQFAALHFHSYVWESNVADIMPHPGTSPETIAVLQAFAKRIGQIPIVLHKESHAYVFNAMLNALNGAALKLVAGGVASVEDVDRAWMGIMKTPIGPFGILDLVGIKTAWDITHYWATATGDKGLQANADFLKGYLDRGKLGMQSGQGFYNYPSPAYREPDFMTGKAD